MTVAFTVISLVGRVQAWHEEPPPCTAPLQPFVYKGCFQDQSSQTLPFRSTLPANNMTVEVFTAECKGSGFRFALLLWDPLASGQQLQLSVQGQQ